MAVLAAREVLRPHFQEDLAQSGIGERVGVSPLRLADHPASAHCAAQLRLDGQ